MDKTIHICFIFIAILFLSSVAIPVKIQSENNKTIHGIFETNYKYRSEYSTVNLASTEYNEIAFDSEQIESDTFNKDILKIPDPIGSDGGLMDSAWPMKCQNQRHTSQSPYSTEANPNTEKWRFGTSSDIESSPVVDRDGMVYISSISDATLHALYPNGTEKWIYQAGGLLWSTPALAEDGTIYITSWDAKLHALYSSNGTLKWKTYCGDPISSSPAIADDGTIYLGVMGPDLLGRICAVYPNGTIKWNYDTDYWITSDPAIGEDGTVYIGSGDSGMYAMYPNGTLRWRFDTGGYIKGHPSISEDGVIYFNSWDNYLYAVYPNGTLKWRTDTGYGTSGSATIANDGIIYFFTETLNAYYPENGTLKWSLDIGGNGGLISPAISTDGTIYVGNHEGNCIVAINPDGTEKWRKEICNLRAASSPIIAEDGTIYIGSSSVNEGGNWVGALHAFGAGKDLEADAGGPYSGNAEESIYFEDNLVLGGALPYSYHWDFGDGNTSDGVYHPQHVYARPGEYVATFTVVDGEQNESSDTANVTVGTSRPTVTITKPVNAIYFANIKLLPFLIPVVIGKITVEVDAYQEDVGIKEVCFYTDYVLRFIDYDEPYEWVWDERLFFSHRLAVYATSNDDKTSSDSIQVWKFF